MRWLASCSSLAAVALALFAVQTTGCATWHTVRTEHPAEYIARERPQAVRMTLPESTLVLSLPSVRGDSILGVSRTTHPPQMLAIPSSNIRSLETQGPPRSARVMLGTIGVAAVAFAIAAIFLSPPHLTNP